MKKCMTPVSFVMAGYNEEKIAARALDVVIRALDDSFENYEIILVDDGSKDNTLSIMKSYEKQYERVRVLENIVNLNYGSAVLRGLLSASGEWVVYDAFDLEMHPADFAESFCRHIASEQPEDIVIYQRETYDATAWRRFASLLNRSLLNILFPGLMKGTPILNHTQMFRTAVVKDIVPLSRSPIFFSPELIFRAKLKGYTWRNEAIRFHSIDGVRSGAFGHVYDICWALLDMFRFRLLLWQGKIH